MHLQATGASKSPFADGQGLGSIPPSLGLLPSGPIVGSVSRDLSCSQNKCYHNARKIFLCLCVSLGVRDNGGNISQAWVTVLWSERREGGLRRYS